MSTAPLPASAVTQVMSPSGPKRGVKARPSSSAALPPGGANGRADESEEADLLGGIFREDAREAGGQGPGAFLADPAHGHAHVLGVGVHRDAARLQHLVDRLGDLHRHRLLGLQAAREHVHDAGELRQADDAGARVIGHVHDAVERQHVVLALGVERDVAHDDHVAVSLDLLEHTVEHLRRVLGVSGVEFLVGRGDPARRVAQALPLGVVAGPADQGADGGLGLLAARTVLGRARVPRQG
jgi:hypothetical protein